MDLCGGHKTDASDLCHRFLQVVDDIFLYRFDIAVVLLSKCDGIDVRIDRHCFQIYLFLTVVFVA